MFPEGTWIVGFFVGAAIGSFLNMLIYRLPLGISISKPRHSICPICKNTLSWGELIPLFSWLFQRGKCKQCGVKIPSRYFWVEFLTGTLWAIVWQQWFIVGPQWDAFKLADPVKAIGYMLFASAIVVAVFTDLAHYIIPDEVNAFMFVVGVGMNIAYAVMGNPVAWIGWAPSSLVGGLVGIVVLWGIAFFGRAAFGKDAMGHGDIKMARGIGAVLLPPLAMVSFGLAVFLGAVLGIGAMFFGKKDMKEEGEDVPEEKTTMKEVIGHLLLMGLIGRIFPKVAEFWFGPEPEEVDDEPEEVPETFGSLLKSLVGYIFCMDILGLFLPKVYMYWFGEDPRVTEVADEDFEVQTTMIPFGPSLAGGALLAMFFQGPLLKLLDEYWKSFTGP